MMFNVGDKVLITDMNVHNMYGTSPDHEFEVSVVVSPKDPNSMIRLKNGLCIKAQYLKLARPKLTHNDDLVKSLAVLKFFELANDNYMFTAYDITKALRKENPSLFVKHEVVTEYIKLEVEDGILNELSENYIMTLANSNASWLSNRNAPLPWIYHPSGVSADDYEGEACMGDVGVVVSSKVVSYFS